MAAVTKPLPLMRRPPSRRACEMKLNIATLEGKDAGSVELSDEIFGLEPRKDLIQRCVNWQLAKRQAGTHKAQGRADVWRTGKKMYKQKGTGGSVGSFAATPLRCRRRFARWRCAMRFRRRPRMAA